MNVNYRGIDYKIIEVKPLKKLPKIYKLVGLGLNDNTACHYHERFTKVYRNKKNNGLYAAYNHNGVKYYGKMVEIGWAGFIPGNGRGL